MILSTSSDMNYTIFQDLYDKGKFKKKDLTEGS